VTSGVYLGGGSGPRSASRHLAVHAGCMDEQEHEQRVPAGLFVIFVSFSLGCGAGVSGSFCSALKWVERLPAAAGPAQCTRLWVHHPHHCVMDADPDPGTLCDGCWLLRRQGLVPERGGGHRGRSSRWVGSMALIV
jgi:hypothetical protein